MSLTGELKNPRSPVTGLVTFAAALVAGAKRGELFDALFKGLLQVESLPKEMTVPPVAGANAGLVGTASDYRLRYHLGACSSNRFIARTGAAYVTGANPSACSPFDWFFANLDDLTTALKPAGRHLADDDEQLLDSYCVVLGLLDAVFRSGWMPELPSLTKQRNTPRSEPLLAMAAEPAIRDVVNLSRSAESAFGPLIDLSSRAPVAYHPNPMFAGSAGIGGADADFVVGDTLFELKSTKRLNSTALREGLLQLVGYCLLDYDDQYRIRKLGLYFSRYEWVKAWPLWTLLLPPARVIQLTATQREPSVDEVEDRLHKLRGLMATAVAGHAIDYEAEFARPNQTALLCRQNPVGSTC
jgi:hypothetical protein